MSDKNQPALGADRLARTLGGRFGRREFLGGCAIGGLSTLLSPTAFAEDKPKQIVHGDFGGDAQRCYVPSAKRFTDKYGVPLVMDPSGPTIGRLKQMVEANHVIWDTFDQDFFYGLIASRQGLLAPVDYSIVDKSKIRDAEHYALPDAVATYWYSNVLAYNKAKLGNNVPQNWVDFWDVKKFPGKRTVYKWCVGILEAALMADGVPMDKVYPMDTDRALNKIKEIKDYLVLWQTGADSEDMLMHGDVDMGLIWGPRATAVDKATNSQVTWTYNQGIIGAGGWFIPKNNPAGPQWASRWIAFNQDPQEQLDVLSCFGMAPTNDAAWKLEDAWQKRSDPATAENAKLQLVLDANFYADHYFDFSQKFLDLVTS
jgi:putative spermidine/putrescine transport system substrate-binding protein